MLFVYLSFFAATDDDEDDDDSYDDGLSETLSFRQSSVIIYTLW